MRRAQIAAVAALALLAPVSAVAAEPGHSKRVRVEKAASAVAQRSVEACARPALTPALSIRRKVRPVNGVSAKQLKLVKKISRLGRQAKAPARAQALAIAATLHGDVHNVAEATRFYRKLRKVAKWQSLPPSIAAHRVLGTPDPFSYEADWGLALQVLSVLSRSRVVDMGNLVSPGGSAPRRCYARGTQSNSLPLPAGTTYSVSTTRTKAVPTASEPTVIDPTPLATEVRPSTPKAEFHAPCGTPVIAVTSGIVEVTETVTAAGPWLITVREGSSGTTTTYAHVQRPAVADGDLVVAGSQLAEVGDFGDVQGCALGLEVTEGQGRDRRSVDPVRWLAAGLAAAEARTQLEIPATEFRFATYNVLGSHLTGRGNDRPDYAPGPLRMGRALGEIEGSGASVVALQEFETPQANVVLADGDWDLYRATPNNTFRDGNTNGNAVGWRKDTWKLVGAREVDVPWDVTLHMPVVTLEHRQTKARVTVMGVHNPATTAKQGNQAGSRSRARELELAMVRSLLQEFSSIPLIVAGDMNERAEAFCGFTGGGYLKSAAGGSIGGCSPPRYGQVDWIFGSLNLSFSSLAVGRPSKAVSDHPMVSSSVTLPAQTVSRADRAEETLRLAPPSE